MDSLHRAQLVPLLAQLEAEVPKLKEDMDAFFEAFEARSWQIARRARPEDEAYVWSELEAIVARSGVNG
jgi:hypothetical protein